MTPHTIHRIAQDIRHMRALHTVEESWLQVQEPSKMREEAFRRINFWREGLKLVESLLASLDHR